MTTDQSNDPKAPSATAAWPPFKAVAYLLALAAEHLDEEAPTLRDKYVATALIACCSAQLGIEELPFCAAVAEILDADAEEQARHCKVVRGEYIDAAPADARIAHLAAEVRAHADELVRIANRSVRDTDRAPWLSDQGARAVLPTLPEAGAVMP